MREDKDNRRFQGLLDKCVDRLCLDGRTSPARMITIATFVFAMVLFFLFTRKDNSQLYEPLVLCVLKPLSLALYVYAVLTFSPRKTPAWLWLTVLAPWWLFCSFLGGSVLGLGAYHLKMLALLLFSAGVAFPFARLTNDLERRHVLDALLTGIVAFCALLWWLTYVAIARQTPIDLLGLKFGIDYTDTGRLLFVVASMHQYTQGFLASALALIVCYLAVSHPSKPRALASILLELTFIPATFLSGGRMVVGGLVVGLLYLLCLAVLDTNAPKKTKIALIVFSACAALFATIYGMDLIYRYLTHSIRDVWYGATTLTSRTDIWLGVMHCLYDHPLAFIFGFSDSNVMNIINSYIPLTDYIIHTHSSYVQMLTIHGLPGLALTLLMVWGVISSGVRLVRAGAAEGVTLADKLLFAVPLCVIVESTTEVVLFANNGRCLVVNALFMLLSGYVVFTAQRLREHGALEIDREDHEDLSPEDAA